MPRNLLRIGFGTSTSVPAFGVQKKRRVVTVGRSVIPFFSFYLHFFFWFSLFLNNCGESFGQFFLLFETRNKKQEELGLFGLHRSENVRHRLDFSVPFFPSGLLHLALAWRTCEEGLRLSSDLHVRHGERDLRRNFSNELRSNAIVLKCELLTICLLKGSPKQRFPRKTFAWRTVKGIALRLGHNKVDLD